ncbi:hypothetical protein CBS76997_6096 [Aspergillus niger]|nr:hypothetical protein CBS12448_6756 [Aspergillus niger]KAI2892584.1 hypothetical protein CBS13152_4722 [Aspergillus niger]KAI2971140.1 hypothetical protein CBS147323_2936 [Aspergillus niger]KAI2983620.1 hypothetical protein CBS147345_11159 [Aspergillus niger]KAI3023440.1 hypothetical protein CBS147347_6830 [Aspergillus niger]
MPPCDYKTSRAESGYAQPVSYELDSIIWERLIGQNEPMHSTSESQQYFSNGVGQGIQESAFYTNLYGPLLPGKLSLQGCTLLRKVSVAAVAINCDLLQFYCHIAGSLLAFADDMEVQGTESLTEYRFATHTIRIFFCKICGANVYNKSINPHFQYGKCAINSMPVYHV